MATKKVTKEVTRGYDRERPIRTMLREVFDRLEKLEKPEPAPKAKAKAKVEPKKEKA